MSLPSDFQMRTDVRVCLLEATEGAGVDIGEVTQDWVPSEEPHAFDQAGWGLCLKDYGACIRALRAVYAGYRHQPSYETETINETFEVIVDILKGRLLEQVG